MAEYINREAAVKAVKDYAHMVIDKGRKSLDTVDDTLNIVARIEKIPAADVVPVVHGWWNADETCSLCGEKSTEGLDATKWNYWLPNYCPHCGAKMDSEA